MPARLPRIFNKRLFLRLSALAFLVLLYYLISWTQFQRGLRNLVGLVLNLVGEESFRTGIGGAPALFLADGRVYAFTANCTYIELLLLAAPFCWRFGRPIGVNLIRLSALAAGLLVLNVGRLTMALFLNQHGSPWTLVHDAPDVLIHIAVIGLAALSALMADDPSAGMRSGPRVSRHDRGGVGVPGGSA